jgi:hypothetical protein
MQVDYLSTEQEFYVVIIFLKETKGKCFFITIDIKDIKLRKKGNSIWHMGALLLAPEKHFKIIKKFEKIILAYVSTFYVCTSSLMKNQHFL